MHGLRMLSAIQILRRIGKDGDFVKSPHAAMYCILRHCTVQQVRFIPQNLYTLPCRGISAS